MTAQHPALIAYIFAKLAAGAAVAKRDAAIAAHKECIESIKLGRTPWKEEHRLAWDRVVACAAARDATFAAYDAACAVADAVLLEVGSP